MANSPAPRRQWNVVAGLAVVLVLAYFAILAVAFFMDKINGALFVQGALPLVTAVLGYFAALLVKP